MHGHVLYLETAWRSRKHTTYPISFLNVGTAGQRRHNVHDAGADRSIVAPKIDL